MKSLRTASRPGAGSLAGADGVSAAVGFPGRGCLAVAAMADDVSATIVSRDFALRTAKIAG
jgi:hypothetical protein